MVLGGNPKSLTAQMADEQDPVQFTCPSVRCRRLQWPLGTASPNGNADIGLRQGRSIIDSVPHNGHLLISGDQAGHICCLILGHHIAAEMDKVQILRRLCNY